MRIESTEARQATADEILDVMRAADAREEVHFHFNSKTIFMSGKEWNDLLEAARRGMRMLRAAT